MTAHKVYAMSVITALTAQNTTGVYGGVWLLNLCVGCALEVGVKVLSVNNQLAVLYVCLDCALESTVHSVILQHVSQVIYWAKVVNTYYLNVIASLSCAEYETADTTKSVNTNLNHFTSLLLFKGLKYVYVI